MPTSNLTFFPNGRRIPDALSSDIDRISDALSDNISLSISPATVSTVHTSTARTRTVVVSLVNSDGEIHTWYNKAYTSGVSIADTSTAGTATIPSTTLTFVNGVATVVVSCDANTWAAAETDTLTVPNLTIRGLTITGVTSVETFT